MRASTHDFQATLQRQSPTTAAGKLSAKVCAAQKYQHFNNDKIVSWKMAERNQVNFTGFRISNKIYSLLNIYINTAIFKLHSIVLFHNLTGI